VARERFLLDHPPALAAIDPSPSRIPSGGGSVRVRARVLDRRGMAVADGTPVTLVSPAGRAGAQVAPVRDGGVDFALAGPSGARRSVHVEIECRGVRFSDDIPVDTGTMKGSRWVRVSDAGTGAPITSATVAVADSTLASGSPSGNYGFVSTNAQAVISAPGYRPAAIAGADTVKLTPWFGGALIGKRFVLDPQGGSPRTAGVGSMGLSASHVNLRVANYLAGFLRVAGAEVRLARTTEEVPLAEDVARMTNRFRADRYVEIRHSAGPPDSAAVVRSFYFPGSANGKKLAAAIGDVVARRLSRPHHGPDETVTYPLQQTACPAIVIAFPAISNAEEEMRLAQAWYLRAQAYALFVGLLATSAVPPDGTLQVDVMAPDRRDWMVTLDGTWSLCTDESGQVVFECVPPGAHELRVRRAGVTLKRDIATTAGEPAVSVTIDASH
jgi:N-acetylmuramoyl-L-alanine amidase